MRSRVVSASSGIRTSRSRSGGRREAERTGSDAANGEVLDISAGEWLLNPGSVGQPRDGDPRAAWLELDLDGWTAAFHRTSYDIEGASAAILAAGLPESLARRLRFGH